MLVYDGDCGFCSRYVRWVQGGRRQVEATPYQRVDLDRFGLAASQLQKEAVWVDGETSAAGAAAIGHSLCTAGGGRALLGRVLLVWPISRAAQAVYGVVARNRHHLGGSGSCALPNPGGRPPS